MTDELMFLSLVRVVPVRGSIHFIGHTTLRGAFPFLCFSPIYKVSYSFQISLPKKCMDFFFYTYPNHHVLCINLFGLDCCHCTDHHPCSEHITALTALQNNNIYTVFICINIQYIHAFIVWNPPQAQSNTSTITPWVGAGASKEPHQPHFSHGSPGIKIN